MSEESVEMTRTNAQDVETVRENAPNVETVRIHTEFITLQNFLKLAGAVDTGGEAKIRIQNCEAEVNAAICTLRGKKLRPGDTVKFHGKFYAVAHGQ